MTDLGAIGTGDDHLGPENLGGSGQPDEHPTIHVFDLQIVRPVSVGANPHGLFHEALADFPNRADLLAILVVDGVLGVDLEELGLLVEDQHWLGEERLTADLSAVGNTDPADLSLDLLARPVGGRHRRTTDGGIDLLTPTGGDMLGPLSAIPIAEFVAAKRVGIPVGRSLHRHARTLAPWLRFDFVIDGTAVRWCAAGMGEAAKQFRRVNGHWHLPALRAALDAQFETPSTITEKAAAAA